VARSRATRRPSSARASRGARRKSATRTTSRSGCTSPCRSRSDGSGERATFRAEDVPLRNAMNEVLRDEYVDRLAARRRQVEPRHQGGRRRLRADPPAEPTLPPRGWASTRACTSTVEGNPLTTAEWEAKKHDWRLRAGRDPRPRLADVPRAGLPGHGRGLDADRSRRDGAHHPQHGVPGLVRPQRAAAVGASVGLGGADVARDARSAQPPEGRHHPQHDRLDGLPALRGRDPARGRRRRPRRPAPRARRRRRRGPQWNRRGDVEPLTRPPHRRALLGGRSRRQGGVQGCAAA
jgi:hypothetical protein